MCARRFLILVFILILLSVAAAFAIFQWGQQLLISQATPQGRFEAPPPGDSGPDYASARLWIARPDFPVDRNPSLWRPVGAAPTAEAVRPVAAFFIHPTTYLRTDRWNAPASGVPDSDSRAELFVRSQASALADVADIWAPRYRQAAYGAFLLKTEDAQKALALAYRDVAAAFDHFLVQNPDRPIILAGHSQGSLHLSRLLIDRRNQLKGRLIAAYVVGWPLGASADLPAMGLEPCSAPDQGACLLSWQSFAEPANPEMVIAAWAGTMGYAGDVRRRSDMVCVNPLTGTANGTASPAANPGTLVPSAGLQSAEILSGRVGARCTDGLLLLDGEIPALGPYVLPGNNYHVYDYALFWGAIREDAGRRVAAWQVR